MGYQGEGLLTTLRFDACMGFRVCGWRRSVRFIGLTKPRNCNDYGTKVTIGKRSCPARVGGKRTNKN